jgi:glycosyltransferase involved in cell wall biosynthesis
MFPYHDWQVLELPPRHFSWRIRGNPLYWSIEERAVLQGSFDLLIATSMVDLSTLRGLVPNLASVPSILYFHENQFAYPHDATRQTLLEAQMVSLYSALAADRLSFNSQYNLETFILGVEKLLSRLPDFVPKGIGASLAAKAEVLPVPFDVYWTSRPVEEYWPGVRRDVVGSPLRLLWVGRFEHDKGGERLLAVLRQLEQENIDYELAITGQQFRTSPPAFTQIETEFPHRLCHMGFLESHEAYRGMLSAADMVLSTANHEFQGLAVMKAVASGCLPVLPSRMSYPEIYPDQYCYGSFGQGEGSDLDQEANAAVNLIVELRGKLLNKHFTGPDVSRFAQRALKPLYEQSITTLLSLTA